MESLLGMCLFSLKQNNVFNVCMVYLLSSSVLCLCYGFYLELNRLVSFARGCWESGEKPVSMGKLAFEL